MQRSSGTTEGAKVGALERRFALTARGTSPRTELLAGLTTFVTMAYIIFVNTAILRAAGMNPTALVIGTILAAAIPTAVLGLWTNLPWALAPGMGYNALFVYTVVIGMKLPWPTALALVFLDGVAFLAIALLPWREKIFTGIPNNLKFGAAAGIGLFIAFIGLTKAGIVQFSVFAPQGLTLGPHPIGEQTGLPVMGRLNDPVVLVALTGLVVTALLMARRVRGALLLGVVATTLLAWGVAALSDSARAALQVSFPKHAADLMQWPDLGTWWREGWLRLDFGDLARHSLGGLLVVFVTFLITDIMDTIGSFSGLASKLGILDPRGSFPRSGEALIVDAAAGMWGPMVGTTTVVTYIESAAGVGEGGRTGLTALWVAVFFLLCLFFVPLVALIPIVATAPALILVGFLMMEPMLRLRLDDITEGVPAFLTLLVLPLTYNIAEGMFAGIVSYVLLKLLTGRAREVSGTMWSFAALLVAGKVLEVVLR
jgi:AGZA family xanthine/uracil permease-like MFS transporter